MWTIIFLLAIVLFATIIRSTFGFGESLIAVPLLSFFLPIATVVPLGVLISITVAGIVMVQDHQKVDFKSAGGLILYALPGIPVGLLLLLYVPTVLTKVLLGLLICIYSLYSLFNKKLSKPVQRPRRWLQICGLLSGILGGAYGLNGPPLVAYGNLRLWSAAQFRATLQAYFLPISFLTMIGYGYQGLLTAEVGHYYLISLPAVIPAIFLGRLLNHKLAKRAFLRYIFWGLALVGIAMTVQSVLIK